MADITPNSYFPDGYFPASYFGGQDAPGSIAAQITASSNVSATLSFTGIASRIVGGAASKKRRAKRPPVYYADIDGKRIYGTQEELDAVFAAARKAQIKVKSAKPKRVTEKIKDPAPGTPVLDAITAEARFVEKARLAELFKIEKPIAASNDDEEEFVLLLVA